jgi:hypothetical protein
VASGEVRRLIITLPPRTLKSLCASVGLPAWFLGHYPWETCRRRFVFGHPARSRANDFRLLVNHPICQATFPAMCLDCDTDREITTTKRGKRIATFIEGTLQKTGSAECCLGWRRIADPAAAAGRRWRSCATREGLRRGNGRKSRRCQRQGGDQASGIGTAGAGDVEGGRGAHERQAKRDVDGVVEGQRLDRDQRLVVITSQAPHRSSHAPVASEI